MKRALVQATLALASLAIVCAVGSAMAASAPKGKIVIKGCQKKKPPVTFDHSTHTKGTKCDTCHHQVKGKAPSSNNCSTCHKEKQGSLGTCADMSTTKNPYHVRCITCHKKAGKASAPTKCNDCHK